MEITWIETILISISLGMDAFSVAVSVGVFQCLPVQVARLSLSFGFFQFIMPVVGWYMGNAVVRYVGIYGRWVAFCLLLAVASHMLYESFKTSEEKIQCDRTTGFFLLALSMATSIDALGVGLGMGAVQAKPWALAVSIGIITAAMTMSGMYLGKNVGGLLGKRMELLGAIILLIIAVKLVLQN